MANKNLIAQKNLRNHLEKKLQQLETQREKLQKQLDSNFNMETQRKLSLVEHSIECTQNRLKGKFRDPRADLEQTIERIDR